MVSLSPRGRSARGLHCTTSRSYFHRELFVMDTGRHLYTPRGTEIEQNARGKPSGIVIRACGHRARPDDRLWNRFEAFRQLFESISTIARRITGRRFRLSSRLHAIWNFFFTRSGIRQFRAVRRASARNTRWDFYADGYVVLGERKTPGAFAYTSLPREIPRGTRPRHAQNSS